MNLFTKFVWAFIAIGILMVIGMARASYGIDPYAGNNINIWLIVFGFMTILNVGYSRHQWNKKRISAVVSKKPDYKGIVLAVTISLLITLIICFLFLASFVRK